MNFLDKIRQKRRAREIQSGYDYAAGVLLETKSVERLEAEIYRQDDPFDTGIRYALHDWNKLMLENDL